MQNPTLNITLIANGYNLLINPFCYIYFSRTTFLLTGSNIANRIKKKSSDIQYRPGLDSDRFGLRIGYVKCFRFRKFHSKFRKGFSRKYFAAAYTTNQRNQYYTLPFFIVISQSSDISGYYFISGNVSGGWRCFVPCS